HMSHAHCCGSRSACPPHLLSFPTRRSSDLNAEAAALSLRSLSGQLHGAAAAMTFESIDASRRAASGRFDRLRDGSEAAGSWATRSEEHTSELQSRENLVCRLLLEKKKQQAG